MARLFNISRTTLNMLNVALICVCCSIQLSARAQTDWRSGQDSPVHDEDRSNPYSGKLVTLETKSVSIAFDGITGALIGFTYKDAGWKIQQDPQLAESFRIFIPTAERSYNPILGVRNRLSSIKQSTDGRQVEMVWKDLNSEYSGQVPITLRATVSVEGSQVTFLMRIENASSYTIASVEWPILGALNRPVGASQMDRLVPGYGTARRASIYPEFVSERGYFGTNNPIQMLGGPDYTMFERFELVESGKQGLYFGTHEHDAREIVRYAFELKPGYENSLASLAPQTSKISGQRVHITAAATHLPFVAPGNTFELSPVVLNPYTGDWHSGVDIYRKWHQQWFRRPLMPEWAKKVHSWQEIGINSSEDDLRTHYADLPRRVREAAQNGVSAIQLVGWNNGGLDRNNPSHDTDPRLGTQADLKNAIAAIKAMGVHVILFNKYNFADTSTEVYKHELFKHMAVDPNGEIYVYPGFMYQTPEQLNSVNTRHFAVACTNDRYWRDLAAKEFQKSIDLGADGVLVDELGAHGGANFCFSPQHGHRVGATLWSGDAPLGEMFRGQIRESSGEDKFLLAGEVLNDLDSQQYSLSYYRIAAGNIPILRYEDPEMPIMISVTGFNDRAMINAALRYRYILSYEPFNFKGNLSDFPLTLAYGKQIDRLRTTYSSYLWDAEFRDTLDARVMVRGSQYRDYSVFRRRDGKEAVVVVNNTNNVLVANVRLDKRNPGALSIVTPEDFHERLSIGRVSIAPNSVSVLLEH